jgi:HPt (histidine-containing phosphotransfer) domain-containing protein
MQHEHISHGRVEQLLDVLKSRQQLVEQMSACERVVGPAKKQWGEFVAGLDDATRLKAESLLAESRSLLEQITSADRDDALVLQQRRLNLGKEIRQTSSARQVHRMYGAAAYGHKPPRMDLQR